MMRQKHYPAPLPGEGGKATTVDEIIRVDHAGEYGARRIYAGQLAVLKNHECAPVLQHMDEQEAVHLETFERLMRERGVRPTALMPLWHVLGYAMGAGTALLGEKAAMACTVAVEREIADHYAEQDAALGDEEAALKSTIRTFREEELEHHDIGIERDAENAPFYAALSHAIGGATRLAIRLSKKL